MGRSYSIADARKRLPSLVRQAESGDAIVLTRRGESVAVLISTEQFAVLQGQETDLWSQLEKFRRDVNLEALNISEIYQNVRDRSPGRDVTL